MELVKKRLANLLSVKSIVTICLTVTFCVLTVQTKVTQEFNTGLVACNQTLTIILTHQLCAPSQKGREEFAINLEDSAVLVAPLIPWSIAGATPLSTVGAPTASIALACYLYLLPMCELVRHAAARRREKNQAVQR